MNWKFWKKESEVTEELEKDQLDELIEQIEDELNGLDPESERYEKVCKQYISLLAARRENKKVDNELDLAVDAKKHKWNWEQLILGGVSTVLSLFFFCGGDAAASFQSLKEAKEEKKKLDKVK